MKFLIESAMQKEPPCDTATLHECGTERTWWFNHYYTVDVNSFDELLRLADINNDGIILSRTLDFKKRESGLEWSIMIYDGYIE